MDMPARWGSVLDLAIAKGYLTRETADRLRRVARAEAPIEEFVQVTGLPEILVRGLDQEVHAQPPTARHNSSAQADLANALLIPTVSPEVLHTDVQRSPDHVGRYPILGLLGRGAMGAVYKAYDPSLHRAIALKTMSGSATEEDPDVAAKRFVREAQSVAKLRHPGIVCVHEQGAENGTLYFTMDLVEGKSFAQALRDGSLTGPSKVARPPSPSAPTVAQSPSGAMPASPEPSRIPVRKAVEVLAQVGEAMGYAHAKGIVHRDLKPANILLDRQGKAYVSDFGLAKVSQASLELTKSQAMMGTAYYMSPEQCSGRSREVTPASDVFALGVILYEALTGQRPFTGESAPEILTRIQSEEPTRPRRVNPGIPQDLETVCLKALDKSPSGRYPTGKEFAADLQRHLNGKQVRARTPSRTGRIVRALGKVRSAVWGLLAALLLAVVVVPLLLLNGAKSRQPATVSVADGGAMDYDKIVATIHPEGGRDWLIVSDMCSKYKLDKEAQEAIEKAFTMNPWDEEIAARYKGLVQSKLAGIKVDDKDAIESKLNALDPLDNDYADKLFQIGEQAEKVGLRKLAEDIYVKIAGDGTPRNRGIDHGHPLANNKLGRRLTIFGDWEDADLADDLERKSKDSESEKRMIEGLSPWQRNAYLKKKEIESKVGSKCQCVSEQPYLIVVQESPLYDPEIIAEDFRKVAEHLVGVFKKEYAEKFQINDLFQGEKAEKVLPVIVYDSRETYVKKNPGIPEWAGGHFSQQDGYVQMFKDTSKPYETLFREGTHQLIAAASELKGGKATDMFWFTEGIATFFEDFKRDERGDFVLGSKSRQYLPLAQEAIRSNQRISFREFLSKSYLKFQIEQSGISDSSQRQQYVLLHFAESWSIVYFLYTYENGKYKDKFNRYFQDEINGKGTPEDMKRIFGDLDQLEKEWAEYIGNLKPD